MKKIIQLEEFAMFLFGIFLFFQLHFGWWWFLILILTPDISMIGYLFGNKAGAIAYNVFHHKAIALVVYVVGYSLHNEVLQLVGIVLFAHSSLDRILGYGLKTFKGFKYTSLGEIGKKQFA
ncbi:MAG TPA: DUF4260 domain-containing protein [Arachidicoccus sp.]